MKPLPKIKFLLVLSTFLLFSPLVFAFSAKAACPDGMDPADCAIITNLFTNNVEQGPWYNQNPSQFAAKVFGGNQDEIFGERYTYAQINWIIMSIAAMLNPMAGVTNPDQFFQFLEAMKAVISKTDASQMPTLAEYSKLGPAGLVGAGMSMLYTNPPASGVQEIKVTAQKVFDLGTGVNSAYAQGFGFNSLNPTSGAIHALWTATRNMSYLITVILLIAAGFLIMFRVKINPQTVVSLQNMIPKLIITLVLITFSFAIAGFVIDLVYVTIVAFVGMLGLSQNILSNPANTINWLTTKAFAPQYIGLQIGNSFMLFIYLLFGGFLVFGLGGVGVFNVLGGIIGAIVGIALALWMFVILIKIFVMLVKSYVSLVLQICFGPLQIMMDLIPGQKGFGPWIRNIIANASVFAVIPIMLILQHMFLWNPITNNILGLADVNQLGGANLNLPFFKGILNPQDLLFRALIGYTIFSMTPKIAEMIRDALKIPPFKYGADFGGVKVGLGYLQGRMKAESEATSGRSTGTRAVAKGAETFFENAKNAI